MMVLGRLAGPGKLLEGEGLSASRSRYGYEALLESPTRDGTSVYVVERD